MPLPAHPNVRNCTHIKVTGQRCGSPALRGEFFCYFHTRVIKGVQQRVDMQLHSMALLEDAEAIQFSLMAGGPDHAVHFAPQPAPSQVEGSARRNTNLPPARRDSIQQVD